MAKKKFVILHSNDMHGDILAEDDPNHGKLVGGLALLSGYINKVRKEEKNVLYVISGDMLQGSVIDSEFKGTSTIEIMNYLAPDIVAIGNHEVDYGLPHLLFLEKLANFPIVNANLYIKNCNKRLMNAHKVINLDGFSILFTGVITESIMDSIKQDNLIGSFITLEEASQEVSKICNTYRNDDIDITILLTHIGFESDKKLAKMLDPSLGVDIIIGGHSHTILKKPKKVNNILITQAGVGTNQIGRFDITVDDATNSIVDYTWELIPIDDTIAEPDQQLLDFISSYKEQVDKKYNALLTKFARELSHPIREVETELGNLIADSFVESAKADVVLIGSGSIRVEKLGPLVKLIDLQACFPYDDTLHKFSINGSQLKTIFNHIMRNVNRNREGECYQVNKGVSAIHDNKKNILSTLSINGKEITDDGIYSICIQGYHYKNSQKNFNLDESELLQNGPSVVVSTSVKEVLEEYLRSHQNLNSSIEGRLIYN
jgi:5'-nucleotidase